MNESSCDFLVDVATERLDQFLVENCPDLSRSQLQALIRRDLVLVNGGPGKPAQRLRNGDRVRVVVLSPQPMELIPQDIPLSIIHDDPVLLVIDKPAGMTVHPGPGHPRNTLVNALLNLVPNLTTSADRLRPGIVHRLDKDTSGLILVAKNDQSRQSLANQFKARTVTKGYTALVWGHPEPPQGIIDLPIGRDPRNRKRMAVVDTGRPAVTHYWVRELIGPFALLELSTKTGRTHQIRTHLSHLGHPLAGDQLYTRRARIIGRHFLHAHYLAFAHPTTHCQLAFTSVLPIDLHETLRLIREGITS